MDAISALVLATARAVADSMEGDDAIADYMAPLAGNTATARTMEQLRELRGVEANLQAVNERRAAKKNGGAGAASSAEVAEMRKAMKLQAAEIERMRAQNDELMEGFRAEQRRKRDAESTTETATPDRTAEETTATSAPPKRKPRAKK